MTRSAADAGAPSATPDERTLTLAREARDAARRVAEACRIDREISDDGNSVRLTDRCRWKGDELARLRAAADALRAGAPDAGGPEVFVEVVSLFAEWLARTQGLSGTLSHYQDVARSWNSYRPSEPIPIDAKVPDLGPDIDAGLETPLRWQRCSYGSCIVVPRPRRSPP